MRDFFLLLLHQWGHQKIVTDFFQQLLRKFWYCVCGTHTHSFVQNLATTTPRFNRILFVCMHDNSSVHLNIPSLGADETDKTLDD